MTIIWRGTLPANLERLDPFIISRINVACHAFAPRAEAHMKATAPWTDRTGAARAGLFARPESDSRGGKITLGHGVDYGIWLEIAHSGAYAVVVPSVRELAPQFMALASRLIFAEGMGG
jgi:hypothetical protein